MADATHSQADATPPLTADVLAELERLKAAYDVALARIKAIEPTPMDERFPEIKASICAEGDVAALHAYTIAARDRVPALILAAQERDRLAAERDEAVELLRELESKLNSIGIFPRAAAFLKRIAPQTPLED